MSYLAFLAATGLYLWLGPGGPLHDDGWFRSLRRRVDAIEPEFWLGFTLLVVVPCAALALVYAVLAGVLGERVAMLFIGTAALFFAFGRADYDALLERFLVQTGAGDFEAGALTLEQAGADIEAETPADFGRFAAKAFMYEGFQRWFPAAFYFLLLGPFWAVAYRLIQLGTEDRHIPVGSLRHLVDWLPSRLLLLTFAVVGSLDNLRGLLIDGGLDPSIETDELLLQGAERSLAEDTDNPAVQVRRVQEILRRSMILWVIIASVIAMAS